MTSTVFHCHHIYSEDGIVDGWMKIEHDTIISISTSPLHGSHIIEIPDQLLLPGIIDIHNHGYHGWSAKAVHRDEIKGLSTILPSIGVTSFLATTSAWREQEFTMLHEIVAAVHEGCEGATVLGIHMEGPFFNPEKHNATAEEEVQLPSLEKMKQYIQAAQGYLRYMTLAPEMPYAFEVMDYLQEQGIITGCGHTMADYAMFEKAKLHGMKTSVHTGNAMRQMDRREVSLMGGALLDSDICCEIICDFFHLSKEMLELMFRIKQDYQRFIMISDSDVLSGMPAGVYEVSGKEVHIQENGHILLADGTINGSSRNVLYGISNLVKKLHIPLADVMRMCSLNPAVLLGIDQERGSLKAGKKADFIILDQELTLQNTYVNGHLKYSAGDRVAENPDLNRYCRRLCDAHTM